MLFLDHAMPQRVIEWLEVIFKEKYYAHLKTLLFKMELIGIGFKCIDVKWVKMSNQIVHNELLFR